MYRCTRVTFHEGNGFHVVTADLPIQRGTRVYQVEILEVLLLCVLSAAHVGDLSCKIMQKTKKDSHRRRESFSPSLIIQNTQTRQ